MLQLAKCRWLFALAFVIASTPSPAAFIEILDKTDGAPLVSTDLVDKEVRSVAEGTTVSGLVPLGPTGGLAVPAGLRGVALTEPSGDFNPPISDLITLRADDQIIQRADGFFQRVAISFLSDTVGSVPLPLAIPVTQIPELDQLQVITNQLNAGALEVRVQSDFFGPEVPEPSTLLLFGVGLAGVVAFRLRRA